MFKVGDKIKQNHKNVDCQDGITYTVTAITDGKVYYDKYPSCWDIPTSLVKVEDAAYYVSNTRDLVGPLTLQAAEELAEKRSKHENREISVLKILTTFSSTVTVTKKSH